METIVLRSKKSGDTVPVSALSHGPGDLSVVVADLSPSEYAGLRRDQQVVGAAPPIPMRLIRPLTESPAPTAAPAVSWGVQAVGAAASTYSGDGVTVAVLDTGI